MAGGNSVQFYQVLREHCSHNGGLLATVAYTRSPFPHFRRHTRIHVPSTSVLYPLVRFALGYEREARDHAK